MVLIWVVNNAKLFIYFEYCLLTWITHASQTKKLKPTNYTIVLTLDYNKPAGGICKKNIQVCVFKQFRMCRASVEKKVLVELALSDLLLSLSCMYCQ
jgi:hypothetical protein